MNIENHPWVFPRKDQIEVVNDYLAFFLAFFAFFASIVGGAGELLLELASLEVSRFVRPPGLGVVEGSRARLLLRFVFVSGGSGVLECVGRVLDSDCSGEASGRSSP
jgi:hypothetical protein